MQRIASVSQQLAINSTSALDKKSPDDVVIVAALRTPLTKAKRGGFKDTPPEVLLSAVLNAIVEQTKIQKSQIQDIIVGNVSQPGAGAFTSRMAQYLAGFPDTTTLAVVNRQCSSGLEACATIAAKIKAGQLDIGIGAGVESMSLYDVQSAIKPELLAESVFDNESSRNCLMPMGQTSENVVQKFKITREKQDQIAFTSHQNAAKAQENGYFNDEIVPVKTFIKNEKGESKEVTISKDDGIRKETTLEGLAKLKPSFKKDGTTTAGNSSQVTDGAAAVLLARRSHAEKLKLPIIGKFIDFVVAGVPPEIMGIGPAIAIPQLLKKHNLTADQIDIVELNEAFARQAVYCIEQIGFDYKKVNPKGGAIALGHPLGCTGARQVSTLLTELKRTNKNLGVISMCIGTGMGAAALIQREN